MQNIEKYNNKDPHLARCIHETEINSTNSTSPSSLSLIVGCMDSPLHCKGLGTVCNKTQ